MAKYKVWLTTKDRYGNTKEIDGGTIAVNLDEELSPGVVDKIEEALPLENYVTKAELNNELDLYATDSEVSEAVEEKDTIRYSSFEFRAE